MTKFVVTLKEDNKTTGTYRLDEKLFKSLAKNLEPMRSISQPAKAVKCIETGEIFNSSREAVKWINQQGKVSHYSAGSRISRVCRGKDDSAFGYHWEFVEK